MTNTQLINEIKQIAVDQFKMKYGFAPAKKDIRIMESSDDGNFVDSFSIVVGGHGYSWIRCCGFFRDDSFDM